MEQGPDRNTLIGIVLISLILGVWMIFLAPDPATPVQPEDPAAVEAVPDEIVAPEAESALRPPTDSTFAAALAGTARDIVVVSDRYRATFSTQGGTLHGMQLLSYTHADSEEAVELVSSEAGALGVVFAPPQGRLVDTRTLYFQPSLDGAALPGDTLRVPEGLDAPVELAFDAPVGGGTLRFVYGFAPDSYEVTFRIEEQGTDVLSRSGGYEVVWDGAIPRAENNIKEETAHSGAYVHWGGDTDMLRLSEPGEAEPLTATGAVAWVAVKTKFFAAVLIPDDETDGAVLEGSQIGTTDAPDSFAQDYAARLEMPGLGAGESADFRLYLGPMQLSRLAAYDLGLYEMVEFGSIIGWMIRPIAQFIVAPSFALLSTFLPNYGWVIIVFAFFVKLVLYPLTKSSYTSMAKMREVQPEMEAIKEKYGDDPQKQQEAMMRLYREKGVNPLGGCLPMLLQYPILIAMWRFFQSTLVLRQESFLWAPDLSAPDPILHLPFSIPLYGDFVAGFTLLMGISMIAQMKFANPAGASITGQQKVIMYAMPAFFFLFFNGFPSGLSLYYLAFNIFTVFQQRWINKHLHDNDDKEAAPKGGVKANGRAPSNGQAKKRAKAKR